MSQTITIRKGLDINIKGKAEKVLVESAKSSLFSIQPPDFTGLTPKLTVKEGENIKAGSPLFFDKYNDQIQFVSPCSGNVKEIVRGLKRRVMAIVIESDNKMEHIPSKVVDVKNLDRDAVKSLMLNAGLWPFLRMRPIDVIANPKDTPKSIFISSFDSNPLAPDNDFIFDGKDAEFNAGLEMLGMLTDGTVLFKLDLIHLQYLKTHLVFKSIL